MSFGEFFTAFSGLGKAYSDGVKEHEQRTALSRLGEQLTAGDLAGAASTAFKAGDLNSGLGLLRLGEARRKDALTQAADQEFARNFGGGFSPGGPIGAPGGGPAPSSSMPSFMDPSNPGSGYLSTLTGVESGGNRFAKNPNSTALGTGQFTSGTWAQMMQERPDLGLTPDGRTDPEQSNRATLAYAEKNGALLQRAGFEPNDGNLYLGHFLGGGGAVRFLGGMRNNPDAPAANYVGADQAAANRPIFFNRDGSARTASEVYGRLTNKFGGASTVFGGDRADSQPAVADPMAPPPGASGLNPAARFAPSSPPQRVASADPGFAPADPSSMPLPPPRPPEFGPGAPGPMAGAALTDSGDPDAPAPGAREATGYYIPGTDPRGAAPSTAIPPGLSGNGRIVPGGLPPSSAGTGTPSMAGGRAMTLPVEAGGPAQPPAPAIPADARIGAVPVTAVTQMQLGQRIPMLMRAVASPHLSEGPRQIANTLLKQALDETRMPEAVKEFQLARANGWTQARNPNEYAREKQRDPGADLQAQIDARSAAAQRYGLQPGTPEFQNYVLGNRPERDPGGDLQAQIATREREGIRLGMAPGSTELRDYALGNRPATERDEGAKITAAIEARRAAAAGLGLEEGTPAWKSYVANGRIGADRDMSASDKKAIADADDRVLAAQGTIDAMNDAKALSAKAYAGPWAAQRGAITGAFGSEAGQATQELDNLITTNALTSLKSIFGAAPTEGERKILLDIQGSSSLPHALRLKVYDRAITAAQSRLQQYTEKATELRGGSYYQTGGGPLGRQGAAAGAPQAAPRSADGPQAAGPSRQIGSEADYNRLPSGAEFTGPDGRRYRKP